MMREVPPPCTCTEEAMCDRCQFEAMVVYCHCIKCGKYLLSELDSGFDGVCMACQKIHGKPCQNCDGGWVSPEVIHFESLCPTCRENTSS